MKVLCAVCGVEGYLEVRGGSQRVLHYQGFVDGKRLYVKHAVMGINGNKQMGVNCSKQMGINCDGAVSHGVSMRARRDLNPRPPAPQADALIRVESIFAERGISITERLKAFIRARLRAHLDIPITL
jgi:hypothetical protein